ncbi:MAG: hypothetical protein C0484_18740 [Rhodospirillum sp.]|nr:hypothetical protein [Rhodospirillum sp.]
MPRNPLAINRVQIRKTSDKHYSAEAEYRGRGTREFIKMATEFAWKSLSCPQFVLEQDVQYGFGQVSDWAIQRLKDPVIVFRSLIVWSERDSVNQSLPQRQKHGLNDGQPLAL